MATELRVSIMDTDVMREVLSTMKDTREAICDAMSQGWDSFSSETQNELTEILERIDRATEWRNQP